MNTTPLLFFLCGWGLTGCGGAARLPQNPAAEPKNVATESDAHAYFELGRRYASEGDSIRAEEYLGLALDRGYPEEKALPILLRVCIEAGRLRTALDYAAPRLKARPSEVGLRYLVATLYLGLGDPTRAREELEAALTRAPHFAPAHLLLATVLTTAFDEEQTTEIHYRAYLRLEPRGAGAAEAESWLRKRDRERTPPRRSARR